MVALLIILGGLLIGSLIVIIIKSIYIPGARKIQAIMLFGKLYTIIANVENKKIYKGKTAPPKRKWDLIDCLPNEKRKINVYFFLWPFFKLYKFNITYTKIVVAGEEREGDKILWKDNRANYLIISRTNESNYLEWKKEYPTVTFDLNTEELASVNIYTNNMVEVTNGADAFFGISNWLEAMTDILHGGQRRLVALKKMDQLNEYSGKEKDGFNDEMLQHANTDVVGLPTFGMKLIKSVFKDYNPSDEMAQKLMNAHGEVIIAEKTGEAKVKKAEKDAIAYAKEQAPIVEWRKKYLVDTGLAKIDPVTKDIIELVPDANVRVSAEAIKALKGLKGTLVMDASLTKMLSFNSKNEEK